MGFNSQAQVCLTRSSRVATPSGRKCNPHVSSISFCGRAGGEREKAVQRTDFTFGRGAVQPADGRSYGWLVGAVLADPGCPWGSNWCWASVALTQDVPCCCSVSPGGRRGACVTNSGLSSLPLNSVLSPPLCYFPKYISLKHPEIC